MLAFITQEGSLAVTKTEVVSVRVHPEVKAALIAAANRERRSVTSMIEFMVMEYCKTKDISSASVPPPRVAKNEVL